MVGGNLPIAYIEILACALACRAQASKRAEVESKRHEEVAAEGGSEARLYKASIQPS